MQLLNWEVQTVPYLDKPILNRVLATKKGTSLDKPTLGRVSATNR
jgi:hypothetical protein